MSWARPRTGAAALRLGNRIAPARFLVFLALLPAGAFAYRALVPAAAWTDAAAIGFDFAAMVFVVSLWPLFTDVTAEQLRAHSRDNDANRMLVLVVTTLVTLAAMAAIAGELPRAKDGDVLAMAKLVGTLLLIWLFANLVFTLHYAHYFYTSERSKGGDVGGLDFPGTKVPDYRDFAYFAFTVGMTFQTSDVAIRADKLRHVVLLHGFGAFVFNIGVIAFTINALGGGSG
ncbi:MAG TPA: DUF1345 domain-containing protein [Novosphingobium sp.]|nr:DUF1345 domain-containing protein [Novosphingobium sp.]